MWTLFACLFVAVCMLQFVCLFVCRCSVSTSTLSFTPPRPTSAATTQPHRESCASPSLAHSVSRWSPLHWHCLTYARTQERLRAIGWLQAGHVHAAVRVCRLALSAFSCRENSELAWQVARLTKERDSTATAVAKLEARLREAEVGDLPRVPRRPALPCTRCTLPCTRKGHPLPRADAAAPTRRNRPIAAVRG